MKDLQKGIAKGKGNRVIYIGASTGRDGIHGATFASEELSEASEEMVPAVQAGDPFMGKRLMEACLELVQAQILVGIQDMGAAGLTSSSVEMAAKGGSGILLNLDAVPQRDPEMTPYEMMLSESQERMLVIVEEKNVAEVHRICQKWEVQSVDIGEVTDDGALTLIHKNKKVTSLPVKTLVDAPTVSRKASEPDYYQSFATVDPVQELADIEVEKAFYQVLASPNVASKRWVYQQYDYMAQGATVVSPGSDAGVIAIEGTKKSPRCNYRWQWPICLPGSRGGGSHCCGGSSPKSGLYGSQTPSDYRWAQLWQSGKVGDLLANDGCH